MTKKELERLREIGRKGGLATVEKHGKQHMSKLAKRMWKKVRETNPQKDKK